MAWRGNKQIKFKSLTVMNRAFKNLQRLKFQPSSNFADTISVSCRNAGEEETVDKVRRLYNGTYI
jgi:hypothetical protein